MIFNRNIFFLLALAFLKLVAAAPIEIEADKKFNIIFMVPDGMPATSVALARAFKEVRDGLPIDSLLELEPHLVGTLRTASNSSRITDSAAAGTAFSVGHKTYNGAIGVDSTKTPRGTIMEALKAQGWSTGLVVNTRITDATPSVFAAHVEQRSMEDEIASQMLGESKLGRVVDIMLGGGRCFFIPKSQGGCRSDERNLIEEVQANGTWTYVGDKQNLTEYNGGEDVQFPFLGLFAPKDIPYELDRNDTFPSLVENAQFALTALEKQTADSDQGFFIMIEGSRVDHCGHDNDPACMANEVLAFDDTFKAVKEFVDQTETDTIVVVVADHETGGLALAYDDQPSWYPQVLLNKTHTAEYYLADVVALNKTSNSDPAQIADFVKNIVTSDLAIDDVTDEEIQSVVDEVITPGGSFKHALSFLTSKRAAIGWSSGGHSNADVNVYGYSNSPRLAKSFEVTDQVYGLAGSHENIEIPKFFAQLAEVDLDEITEQLNA